MLLLVLVLMANVGFGTISDFYDIQQPDPSSALNPELNIPASNMWILTLHEASHHALSIFTFGDASPVDGIELSPANMVSPYHDFEYGFYENILNDTSILLERKRGIGEVKKSSDVSPRRTKEWTESQLYLMDESHVSVNDGESQLSEQLPLSLTLPPTTSPPTWQPTNLPTSAPTEPVYCDEPNIPNSIHIDIACAHMHVGEFCIFSCLSGFSLNGIYPQCMEDGSWTTVPTCDPPVRCSAPSVANSDRVDLLCSSIPPGGFCVILCMDGFELYGNFPVCLTDGSWSETPGCYPAECSTLNIENSNSQECADISVGDMCEVTCDEGFLIGGFDSAQFQCAVNKAEENTVWIRSEKANTSSTQCLPTRCADPPDVMFSDVRLQGCGDAQHGEYCDFECSEHYQKSADTRALCFEGIWQDVPECQVYIPSYPLFRHNFCNRQRDGQRFFEQYEFLLRNAVHLPDGYFDEVDASAEELQHLIMEFESFTNICDDECSSLIGLGNIYDSTESYCEQSRIIKVLTQEIETKSQKHEKLTDNPFTRFDTFQHEYIYSAQYDYSDSVLPNWKLSHSLTALQEYFKGILNSRNATYHFDYSADGTFQTIPEAYFEAGGECFASAPTRIKVEIEADIVLVHVEPDRWYHEDFVEMLRDGRLQLEEGYSLEPAGNLTHVFGEGGLLNSRITELFVTQSATIAAVGFDSIDGYSIRSSYSPLYPVIIAVRTDML